METSNAIEHLTSAQAVALVDHLLQEILLRLPIRSLLRFKSVSKRWLSLIANPEFALIHSTNHNPNPALGLFFPCAAFGGNPNFEYICFDVQNPITPPFTKLEVAKDPAGIIILQSCKGLLLCSSFCSKEHNRYYYVYNPTTKQFITLPKPGGSTGPSSIVHGISLAFDPARSPQYKVISIRGSSLGPASYQIEIYSSDSVSWRISGAPFSADHINFQNGVYWNGAVHWISNTWGDTTPLYFNVDKRRLNTFPMPAVPENYWQGEPIIAFFGESCDHLHLIPTHQYQSQFNVYELKSDYSGWVVKYNVDLAVLSTAFPKIIRKRVQIIYNTQQHERGWVGRANLNLTDLYDYAFSVFALVRGEKEDKEFLVLQIPGKAIRYNLVSNTFHKLCDFKDGEGECCLRFNATSASPYIESLFCV